MHCPWAEDLADAKRVATKLGIEFLVFDFEKDYKEKVVDYMLEEFRLGRTPNPDVMCNQEIKFKLFFEIARQRGADLIATGHYARTADGKLLMARDQNKDQTYFLYRVSSEALRQTIFPLGDMLKTDVKKMAEENGLHNAYKKESMGVCFVGDVGMRDFLQEYFETKFGDIVEEESGEILGKHSGAIFHTIGQRHGLNVGSDLPYYVTRKDVEKNIVYVSKNINHENLWTRKIDLKEVFLREKITDGEKIMVRLRHRAELLPVVFKDSSLLFDEEIRVTADGQSAVLYKNGVCLGGGVIN
jgi:tRNA (5-methylaminomethyl-2-thiouridylate)-methyltransferase